jgi:hypothetical protein
MWITAFPITQCAARVMGRECWLRHSIARARLITGEVVKTGFPSIAAQRPLSPRQIPEVQRLNAWLVLTTGRSR